MSSLSIPLADAPPLVDELRLVRQPVFDRANRLAAYALYDVDGPDTVGGASAAPRRFDAGRDGRRLQAIASIGLPRLAAAVPAIVPIGADALVAELHTVLDARAVVLALSAQRAPTPALLDALGRAHEAGYAVHLTEWQGTAAWQRALPATAGVRVRFGGTGGAPAHVDDARARLVERALTAVASYAEIARHATHVDDGDARRLALQYGFTHVEGAFHSAPETVGTRTLSMEQVTIVRLYGLLADPDVSERALEEAFRSHPSLSLALLRIVGSAAIGARDVTSVAHAIRLLGRTAVSRWLLILLAAGARTNDDLGRERILRALARARFAELLAANAGLGDPQAHFLVGLLSSFDRLLGEALPVVLARLPVSAEARDALLHGNGPLAATVALAADWEAGSDSFGAFADVPAVAPAGGLYAEAVQWARECVSGRD